MFIMPSFKKSLIVEQFQGNYLKLCVLQIRVMHQSIPPAPSPSRANPRELAFFFSWMANSRGRERLSCQMPGGGDESRGRMPRPRIVLMPVFIFVRCNRSQSCSSKEMKHVLRSNSRFLKFEGRKMS